MEETSDLQNRYWKFCSDRDWDQFHSPKNLAMALAGEVGELVSLLQWTTEDQSREITADSDLYSRLSEEVADVQLYLWHLAEKSGIDINEAVALKLAVNDTKYPVEKSRGNSKKYTQI